MKMERVYPIEERCINCRLCEVACVVEHSKTKNPVGAYFVENLRFNVEESGEHADPAEALQAGIPKPLNRCSVNVDNSTGVYVSCRHCETPECVLACKTGALYKREDGRVLLTAEKCVGCWMCIMACSYGVITRNPYVKNVPQQKNNGINHHCDLCPDRKLPACVTICPTQALVFKE